jgi:hypothetical protein
LIDFSQLSLRSDFIGTFFHVRVFVTAKESQFDSCQLNPLPERGSVFPIEETVEPATAVPHWTWNLAFSFEGSSE